MTDKRREIQYRRVDELVLDAANYRLPPSVKIDDQTGLTVYLEEHYDLEEIGWSITNEGYRPEEPLIAVREGNQLVIVEGNRRLATLLLLTDSEFRGTLPAQRKREFWDELAQEAAAQGSEQGWSLDEVPVVIYGDRSEVEASLGFRHVSGIAPWSSESKARFIADLVERGHDFKKVARMIGSRSDYVRRQFVAHLALEEASESGIDTSRAERFFGVYYRSLSNPLNRSFVGLPPWEDVDYTTRSVLTSGPERLSEFLLWIFGSDEEQPVITDSRQLDQLGRVLGDSQATQVLRSERDLSAALEVVGGDRSTLFSDLRTALGRLRRANGVAWEFAGDDELIDMAQRAEATAQRILDQLREGQAE